MKDCKFFPRIAACIKYMTHHPDETKETLARYKKIMHPDAKKAAKDSYLKVLQGSCLPDDTDLDELADQLTNASSWNDGSDDYSFSIAHMAHQITCSASQSDDHHSLSKDIQPIQYPDEHMMRMIPTNRDNIIIQALPSDVVHMEPTNADPPPHRLSKLNGQCTRVDTRRDLADTGASVSATGRLDILHHFTPYTPYEIMGYDGITTRAAGQGIAYVRSSETEEMDEMFFVYIPSIDGTIISLEHHTRTHPRIHKWTQEAVPTSDTGCVTFRDIDDNVVSRYQTRQERGLHYIQDLEFYPVQLSTIAKTQVCEDETIHDALTIKTKTPWKSTLNCIDFDCDLARTNLTDQLTPVEQWTLPRISAAVAVVHSHQMKQTEKDVANFEIWHQRLAHCSENACDKHRNWWMAYRHSTVLPFLLQ